MGQALGMRSLVWSFGLLLAGAGLSAKAADELQLLQQINQAASSTSFIGVFSHQQTQGLFTARLYHSSSPVGPLVRLESLDGPPREIVRGPEGVWAYLPDRREIRITPHLPLRPDFPALFLGSGQEVLQHYRLQRRTGQRVAGLETEVIELVPNDGYRWRVRCWVERQRRLLLRQQLLDHEGSVREEYVFSEIRLGPVQERLLKSRFAGQAGWTQMVNPMRKLPTPPGLGAMPAGFALTAALASADGRLRQWVVTDGLATLSLFAEQVPSDGGEESLSAQQGSLSMVSRRRGDLKLTALGEVPIATALALVEAFPQALLQQAR